jgi:hypothetical protein
MCVSLQLQNYETYQISQDKTDKNNIKYNFLNRITLHRLTLELRDCVMRKYLGLSQVAIQFYINT